LPFVGSLSCVARYLIDPIGWLERAEMRYGALAAVSSEGKTRLVSGAADCPGTVIIFDSDLHRRVLRDDGSFHKSGFGRGLVRGKPSAREKHVVATGEGLFALNGPEHHRARKLMMPAFSKVKLDGYREDMASLALRAMPRIARGGIVDLHAEMSRLTLQIASVCLFGQDPERATETLSPIIVAALGLLTNLLVWAAPYDWPGLPYRKLLDLAGEGNRALRHLIDQRRQGRHLGRDVLDALITARDADGQGLNDDELASHAAVLLLAGHETSATALTWTLFLLSQHPRVARDLHDELAGELRGDPPRVDQLDRLPLLDRVVKESLRILPPVPLNHRIAARDAELGGHRLPAGTEVFISLYNLHRHPGRFPAPKRFRPDRWVGLEPAPHEYAPFGGGSRTCIGAGFARLEIKIVLATLLQRVFPEVAAGARIDPVVRVTLGPRRGLPARLHDPGAGIPRVTERAAGRIRTLVTTDDESSSH